MLEHILTSMFWLVSLIYPIKEVMHDESCFTFYTFSLLCTVALVGLIQLKI